MVDRYRWMLAQADQDIDMPSLDELLGHDWMIDTLYQSREHGWVCTVSPVVTEHAPPPQGEGSASTIEYAVAQAIHACGEEIEALDKAGRYGEGGTDADAE